MCESLHHKDFLLVFAASKMCLLGCSVNVTALLLLYYVFYYFSSTYRFTKCSECSLLFTNNMEIVRWDKKACFYTDLFI